MYNEDSKIVTCSMDRSVDRVSSALSGLAVFPSPRKNSMTSRSMRFSILLARRFVYPERTIFYPPRPRAIEVAVFNYILRRD